MNDAFATPFSVALQTEVLQPITLRSSAFICRCKCAFFFARRLAAFRLSARVRTTSLLSLRQTRQQSTQTHPLGLEKPLRALMTATM